MSMTEPYAPPPPPPLMPPVTAHVPDYLVFSILVTLFCCLPFGIVGIVFAAKANSLKGTGDIPGALNAARTAKIWCWLGFGCGLLLILASVVMVVLGVIAGIASSAGV
jgi:hypothetical protein